jgi:hypothetical protein
MKEMNENQLSSWQPRRPSEGLRRRILKLTGEEDASSARWLWSCVAPTMACALLTLMAFSHDSGGLELKVPMSLILSNQNNAAFASGGEQTGQNHLAAVSFDWTNHSNLGSSIRFTPAPNFTN